MKDDGSTLEVQVEGMRCPRCVREVTARLRDLPGVHTLSADPEGSLVRLTGSVAIADIVTALAGTPYTVEQLSGTTDRAPAPE